jgi:fido (protein-threonine AMPylation protein)
VSTFGGFCDVPGSPFYCSEGLSPTETWNRSVAAMADLLLEIPELVSSPGFGISPELLCAWHEQIFRSLFPSDAGRLRWRRDGDWEHVYFGGNVGTRRSRRTKEYRGIHPKRLRQRVQRICIEFNEARRELSEAPSGPARVDEASYVAARLYSKLLRAHPWVDGNLRVAFIALQAALWWLGLPRVTFLDLERHDDMAGVAFRGDHEPYRQLAEYIARHIPARSSNDGAMMQTK